MELPLVVVLLNKQFKGDDYETRTNKQYRSTNAESTG